MKSSPDIVPEPSDLPVVSQSALDQVLELHDMYLRGIAGGARAVVKYKNLSNLDFRSYNLNQADFTGSAFVEANLSGCNLTGCVFFACDLRNANLRKANLSRSDLRGAYMAGADMSGANLERADLREGKIMTKGDDGGLVDRKRSAGAAAGARTVLTGARLTEANLKQVDAIAADFSDADLTGAYMERANLERTSFMGTNLSDTDMTGAQLNDVIMRDAIISGLILDRAVTDGLNLEDALDPARMGSKLETLGLTLSELVETHALWVKSAGKEGEQLDLSGYDLSEVLALRRYSLTAIRAVGSNFVNQDLRKAEMQSAVFDKSDFRDCRLSGADLRGSSFRYANLTRADLTGASLSPLIFKRAGKDSERAQRCDFSGASMRYCVLKDTDLRDGVLMGVDLTGATLTGCDLSRADLTGAILKGAVFKDTKLDDAAIDVTQI